MCLVISVLLAALGINFYLNGFYIQAFLMGFVSLGFIFLMIKNIPCRQGRCGIEKAKNIKDEKRNLDSQDSTQSNQQELESK